MQFKREYTELLNIFLGELSQTDWDHCSRLFPLLDGFDRIFLAGAGRSRMVASMFAMRLMHCGYNVFVVGETTTPSIGPDDLLIIVSGSGETKQLISYVDRANDVGAETVLITANPKSTIANRSGLVIRIGSDESNTLNELPLGSKFELSTLMFFELVILNIVTLKCIPEEELKRRHANLE
jgi:6-phospho 3-hexuloisomerase